MIRVLSAFLVAVLMAFPAAAASEEPRFFLERIAVSGVRWSSEEVLLSESRLHEGRAYSESELRDAVARIRRLPFVLETDFRLEKGSVRDQYVLAIDVIETAPLFSSLTIGRVVIEPVIRRPPPTPPGGPRPPVGAIPRRTTFRRDSAAFGGRWFIGANGVAHAALEKFGDLRHGKARTSAGYTQYDVFGSGVSLALLVTHDDREYLPGGLEDSLMRTRDELSYSAVAAVPLFSNQSVRLSWERTALPVVTMVSADPEDGFQAERFRRDVLKAQWIYDTTDDPLLPTRGTIALLGGSLSEEPFARPEGGKGVRQSRDVNARLARYWDLTPRQSVFAGAELESHFGWSQLARSARLGYTAGLLNRDQSLRYGELRFDAAVERVFYNNRGRPIESYATISTGLSYRNRWGIARFDFEYLSWRNLAR